MGKSAFGETLGQTAVRERGGGGKNDKETTRDARSGSRESRFNVVDAFAFLPLRNEEFDYTPLNEARVTFSRARDSEGRKKRKKERFYSHYCLNSVNWKLILFSRAAVLPMIIDIARPADRSVLLFSTYCYCRSLFTDCY